MLTRHQSSTRSAGARGGRRVVVAILGASLLAFGSSGVVLAITAVSYTFTDLIVDVPNTFNTYATNDFPASFSYPDPAHGTIQLDGAVDCSHPPPPYEHLFVCTQQITYVPDAGFVGTDDWQYTAIDSLNGDLAYGLVHLSYAEDSNPPTGVLDLNSADGNSAAGWTNGTALLVRVDAYDDYTGVARVRLANFRSGGSLLRAQAFDYPDGTPHRLPWSLAIGRVLVGARGTPPLLEPGTYKVYAQWRDGAGNWTLIKSATIKVDPFPPTLAALSVSAGWKRFMPGVPIHLDFPASDTGGSGVALYELQTSVNGAAWVDAGYDASPGYADLDLSPDATHRFRARARDLAGSWTPWVTSPTFKPTEVDEASSSIAYAGAWRDIGVSKYASAAGATATLKFTGKAIGWASVVGPSMGKADVYIDGVFAATINLNYSTVVASVDAYQRTWASSGTHTIKIKVLGTAGHPQVHVDWFMVLK